ncbi:glycine cleavage system regulatory protein [Nannochloropsis oceanica]
MLSTLASSLKRAAAQPITLRMAGLTLARASMMTISRASTPADSHFILTATGPDRAVGGMSVITHPVTAERANQIVPKPVWKAIFSVEGVNHPGLVYKVTELFFARGLRVEKLHTETKIAPFGGTVLFLMDGTIISEKAIDFKELKEASDSLSSFLGIDLELKPVPANDQ